MVMDAVYLIDTFDAEKFNRKQRFFMSSHERHDYSCWSAI